MRNVLENNLRVKHVNQKHLLHRVLASWQLYILLLPTLLYIIIFCYIPMYGVTIGFKNYTPGLGIMKSPWIGFGHFVRFIQNPSFWKLIQNTLGISVYTLVAGFPLPIILALAINYIDNKRFKSFSQTITYAPHFISVVVLVGIMMIFLSPRTGLVNNVIRMLGGESIFFFGEKGMFKHMYVWSGIWQDIGWNSIIYVAALSSIDQSIHESALIDGASRLKRIIHIDFPGIMPTITILLILNVGNIMSVGFEKAFLMQNSLNADSSEIISTYVYKQGLVGAQFSYSTAVELINSVINFILLITVNGITKKINDVSLW